MWYSHKLLHNLEYRDYALHRSSSIILVSYGAHAAIAATDTTTTINPKLDSNVNAAKELEN